MVDAQDHPIPHPKPWSQIENPCICSIVGFGIDRASGKTIT
jgi:hypothetical protein